MDRLSNIQGAGARMVLQTSNWYILEQALRLGFKASNNEAKYEALLLARHRVAEELQLKELLIYCDSILIANQAT